MKKTLSIFVALAACVSLCAAPAMASTIEISTDASLEINLPEVAPVEIDPIEVISDAELEITMPEVASVEIDPVEISTDASLEFTAPEVADIEVGPYIDQILEKSLYGDYRCVSFEGDQEASIGVYTSLMVLPDGTAVIEGDMVPYVIDGDTITIDVSGLEGYELFNSISITAKQAPAVFPEDFDAEMYMSEADDNALYVTVVMNITDDSDPLNVKDVTYEATSMFAKYIAQYDFVEDTLTAYEWKLGDNTLTFADSNINLNDGAKTGVLRCLWSRDEYHATIYFDWDGADEVRYYVSDVKDGSISLTNMNDKSNVLELVMGDAIVAE